MSGLHFHPLRVAAVRPDGDDARVVTFDVPADQAASFRFEPGQYLTLRAIVGGAELRRSYSICAAPGEALRVGVRQVPGGAFSSWLQQTLAPHSRAGRAMCWQWPEAAASRRSCRS